MHVLTNAEKLIPLRDAASLAESRRLAGMRMVTGTTSPSTRYERISVSPASCSIKSEYVIASHAFKPQYKCINYIPTWEQRKLGELYEKNDERNTFGLGAERTLSIATMTFNSEGNGADASSLPNYKVIRVGDVAFEGHSNKSFAYGRFVVNAVADGIMSPRFSCLRPKNSYPVRFWKYYIHSEQVMRDILVRATKSGTMMNELVIDDLFKQSIAVPQEAEQQAIGYFFSHLDTLITLHQRKRQWLKWLDEGGEGTHHDIDILVFKFADDMKISVLCGVHACMTKSLGHTGNRYAGKQQQRGMGVP